MYLCIFLLLLLPNQLVCQLYSVLVIFLVVRYDFFWKVVCHENCINKKEIATKYSHLFCLLAGGLHFSFNFNRSSRKVNVIMFVYFSLLLHLLCQSVCNCNSACRVRLALKKYSHPVECNNWNYSRYQWNSTMSMEIKFSAFILFFWFTAVSKKKISWF